MQREETLKLLDIPCSESKTFDPKVVHDSLRLFKMVAETLFKEIRISELNFFIQTHKGCEIYGIQEASLFTKSAQRLEQFLHMFMSRK